MSDPNDPIARTDPDELLRTQAALVRSAQRRMRGGGQRSSAVGLLLFIGAWYVLSWLWTPTIFPSFPSPTQVALSLERELASGRMLPHILVTADEVLVGFFVGTLLGVMMGILVAEFGVLRRFFVSHATVSQTMPIATLAPILILWMGSDRAPEIALAALITFFPVLENTVVGLRGIESDPAPRWQTLWKLRFPHSIPFILAGLRVAVCPVIVGVVVAEYLGGTRGLGYLMISAVNAFNAASSLAVFVLLVAMSVGFYYVFGGIEKHLLKRWKRRERR
jgi:NitT/TauT family transport system permease protein